MAFSNTVSRAGQSCPMSGDGASPTVRGRDVELGSLRGPVRSSRTATLRGPYHAPEGRCNRVTGLSSDPEQTVTRRAGPGGTLRHGLLVETLGQAREEFGVRL